jgi:hypothetical protein
VDKCLVIQSITADLNTFPWFVSICIALMLVLLDEAPIKSADTAAAAEVTSSQEQQQISSGLCKRERALRTSSGHSIVHNVPGSGITVCLSRLRGCLLCGQAALLARLGLTQLVAACHVG